MADFDLARVFDAALCPIDTITYLSPPEAARHLEAMGRHLRPGAPYLVEVVLDDPGAPPVTRWRSGHTGVEVSSEWTTLEPGRVRARLEVLDGPEAGRVVDEVHVMTAWTPEAWAALVAASPLELEGTVEQSGRFWQRLVASRA
jgi:hypothetical protein